MLEYSLIKLPVMVQPHSSVTRERERGGRAMIGIQTWLRSSMNSDCINEIH